MNTCISISISLLISCSFQCNPAANNLKTLMHFLIMISKNISNHSQAIVVLLLISASLAIMMVLELPPRLSFSSQVKTESL